MIFRVSLMLSLFLIKRMLWQTYKSYSVFPLLVTRYLEWKWLGYTCILYSFIAWLTPLLYDVCLFRYFCASPEYINNNKQNLESVATLERLFSRTSACSEIWTIHCIVNSFISGCIRGLYQPSIAINPKRFFTEKTFKLRTMPHINSLFLSKFRASTHF